MNRYNLRIEDIPAYYEIRMVKSGLCVDIHAEVMNFLEDILKSDSPLVRNINDNDDWKFLPIAGSDRFGFNGVLCLEQDKKRKKWTNVTFDHFAKNNAYEVSRSLGLLFMAMSLFEGNTYHSKPQFMLVDNFFMASGLGGAGFCSYFSLQLIGWIKKKIAERNDKGIDFCKKISRSMRSCYFCMNPGSRRYFHQEGFRVSFRDPAWISLSCPGDACDLSPECFHDGSDEGYLMLPHNVDNAFQQFSLLMGLAKIHMLARKDGF